MAKPRRLEAANKPLSFAPPQTGKPTWMQHTLKDHRKYNQVSIWQLKDLDRYDEAAQYMVDLTEALFKSPNIFQATVYDNCCGSAEGAKAMHAAYEAMPNPSHRIHAPELLDWMIFLRFAAVDYEAVQKKVQAHIDAVLEKMPVPDYINKLNAFYYIENHAHYKHEEYDYTAAQCVVPEGTPGSNKFGDCGFSWPSRDQFDPTMMKNYIDWYQEVRQHDVLRGNHTYEVGHMWLKISSEKPFEPYVMTMYEYNVNDIATKMLVNGSGYWALGNFRGDGGLYDPYMEGCYMVLQEWFKQDL